MPDAIGFSVGTVILGVALAIFGIVGRILDVVAGEIRYTIAPAVVDGVRAWGPAKDASRGPDDLGGDTDDRHADGDGDRSEMTVDPRDPGLVAPVQAVRRRGPHRVAVAPTPR